MGNPRVCFYYYTIEKDGKTYCPYTKAQAGTKRSYTAPHPWWNHTVADIHSHAAYDVSIAYVVDYKKVKVVDQNNVFSTGDIQANDELGYPRYLASPDGQLQKYDPETKGIKPISEDMPSDCGYRWRVNGIEPIYNPKLEIYGFKDAWHDLFIGSVHHKGNDSNGLSIQSIISFWLSKNPSIKINP